MVTDGFRLAEPMNPLAEIAEAAERGKVMFAPQYSGGDRVRSRWSEDS